MKSLSLPTAEGDFVFAAVGSFLWPALVCMAVMSVIVFLLMKRDKAAARRRGAPRIPERRLFLLALLGGSPGAMLGMLVWRHKTEKWYFALGMPLILLGQVLALWLLGSPA